MDQARRLPSWSGPVAGVVLVIALVVIGLSRGPVELDPETPEGAVQSYIDAVVRGDYDTAASWWHDQGCIPTSVIPSREHAVSASLVDVELEDDDAVVEVRLVETTTDPLGNLAEHHEWFHLVRVDEGWRIRQPSWPYYAEACEVEE